MSRDHLPNLIQHSSNPKKKKKKKKINTINNSNERMWLNAGTISGDTERRLLQEHKGDVDDSGGGDPEVQQRSAMQERQSPRRPPQVRRPGSGHRVVHEHQSNLQRDPNPPTMPVAKRTHQNLANWSPWCSFDSSKPLFLAYV